MVEKSLALGDIFAVETIVTFHANAITVKGIGGEKVQYNIPEGAGIIFHRADPDMAGVDYYKVTTDYR